MFRFFIWLVVWTPLKDMSSSTGMMTFPIYGKIKVMFQSPPTSFIFFDPVSLFPSQPPGLTWCTGRSFTWYCLTLPRNFASTCDSQGKTREKSQLTWGIQWTYKYPKKLWCFMNIWWNIMDIYTYPFIYHGMSFLNKFFSEKSQPWGYPKVLDKPTAVLFSITLSSFFQWTFWVNPPCLENVIYVVIGKSTGLTIKPGHGPWIHRWKRWDSTGPEKQMNTLEK